jgi:DinB superfamily
VDISEWLVASLDDTVGRWRSQVIGLVPGAALVDRIPGGNSMLWATYHVARHADLALTVLGADREHAELCLAALPAEATEAGAGLQEVQQPWFALLSVDDVQEYAEAVFAAARAWLATATEADLDAKPDARAALQRAGLDAAAFDWLYDQWQAGGVALLARWPLSAHITHHVGEMVSTRNQMGLSPFR